MAPTKGIIIECKNALKSGMVRLPFERKRMGLDRTRNGIKRTGFGFENTVDYLLMNG